MNLLPGLSLKHSALLALFALPLLAVSLQAKPDPLEEEIKTALQRSGPVPANAPIPVVDFLRPSRISSLKLNPSGTAYAARVSPGEDRYDLYVHDFIRNKPFATKGGMYQGRLYDVINHHWLDDTNLFYEVGRDRQFFWRMMAADYTAFDRPRIVAELGVSMWLGQPAAELNHPYIWLKNDPPEGFDRGVLKVDPSDCMQSNQPYGFHANVLEKLPKPPSGSCRSYQSDNLGQIRFAVTSEKDKPSSLWYLTDAKKWERSPIKLGKWNIRGAGNDTYELIAAPDNKDGESSRLVFLDAKTGEQKGVLHEDREFSLTKARLLRAGEKRRIVGIQYEKNLPYIKWFDEEYEALHGAFSTILKGLIVRIESMSQDEKTLILSAYNDTTPLRYFLFKKEGLKLAPITSSRPWIDPARMSPMKRLSFKTRDGLTMDAYVTLPAGASAEKPAPLVVMPHGGPFVRDSYGWDPVAQLLASRGYAVLQTNYRGSLGYDWSMAKEDKLLFRHMHDDVTDSVKALLETRVVDKGRIAIMGGSFGGYLALCGAAFEPTLYRCAITKAGIFDWEQVMKESKRNDDSTRRFELLRNTLGDPAANKELFDQISPLRHVSNIRIPMFVAHGEEDRTAYITESKALVKELRRLNIPHEKHWEDDAGHSYSMLEQRARLYHAILAFLDRNLAPAPANP